MKEKKISISTPSGEVNIKFVFYYDVSVTHIREIKIDGPPDLTKKYGDKTIRLNIKDEKYALTYTENNEVMPFADALSDEIAKQIGDILEINEE